MQTTTEVQSTTDEWERIVSGKNKVIRYEIVSNIFEQNCKKSKRELHIAACTDAKNAFSGVSDCPFRVTLCKLAEYKEEMERECSKTCGFC